MTDKPTPKEIDDLVYELRQAGKDDTYSLASAVLAKWGSPAPVGVGEVAERYRNAIARACEGWTMPDGLRKHLETALWSPPTQQPAHAQAASSAVLKAIREANMQLVRTGDDAFMLVPYKAAEAQATEPFCWHWENTFNGGTGTVKKNPETLGINMAHPDHKWTALYTAPRPVAREPLTPERVKEIVRGAGYDQCGIPDTEREAFINGLRHGEDAHGITGDQHGAE